MPLESNVDRLADKFASIAMCVYAEVLASRVLRAKLTLHQMAANWDFQIVWKKTISTD